MTFVRISFIEHLLKIIMQQNIFYIVYVQLEVFFILFIRVCMNLKHYDCFCTLTVTLNLCFL